MNKMGKLRNAIHRFVSSPAFHRFITGLIVFNAIIIGSIPIYAKHKLGLLLLDWMLLWMLRLKWPLIFLRNACSFYKPLESF